MLEASGPSGFYNAPVTKAIFFGTASVSILAAVYGSSIDLQLKPLLLLSEPQRILGSQAVWSSSTEVLFGTLLVYNFRLIERQWGSVKYASFGLLTTIISFIFQLLLAPALTYIPTGPYGFLFATLFYYFRSVPCTQQYVIGSLTLSEKSFLYMFALQLMISKSIASVATAATGLLAGMIVITISPLFKWRIPVFVNKLAIKYILPLIQSTGPRSILRSSDTMPRSETRPSPAQPSQPSEQDITLLVSMGFDRDIVVQALQASQNNVELAAARLLDEMS